LQTANVEGVRYVSRKLSLPDPLPLGYHQLRLELQGKSFESLLLSAPLKAYVPTGESQGRAWGVFIPLYALHSQRGWGSGDFSDLAALVDWVTGLGGGVVGTLPMLTAFLDEPFDPSPYAPASRLFWNEFYVDVTRVPELKRCPAAQAVLESSAVQRELEALRSLSLVDYRRQMAVKRTILAELAQCFFAATTEQHASFQGFVQSHPAVEDYACFRAIGERLRAPWPQWSQPLRDGVCKEGDYHEEARRYHLYVQWLAHEQLKTLSEKARAQGPGLYLDLPLGVHLYGYDVWRERDAFAIDASGGAPPDAVFTKGQDWGFPPLHPEKIKKQGYRYLIAYLRHHLRHAGLLRIDHVMGLHRLFWVPKGLEAREGVYVRYPAEDLYAILSLESHRHQSWIVGENLGTVPSYVNATLARHRIHRMYVVQYELPSEARRPLRAVPADSVASLNTHDMPPFAAFWQGLDIKDRLELGLMDEAGFQLEQQNHLALKEALLGFLQRKGWLKESSPDDVQASLQAILKACLTHLAASPSRVVLINLEDLWLETLPQNVPATGEERPNWRRKARHAFAVFGQMPQVLATLREVDRLRKREKGS
jgi:4-alpha-glucanotransferase